MRLPTTKLLLIKRFGSHKKPDQASWQRIEASWQRNPQSCQPHGHYVSLAVLSASERVIAMKPWQTRSARKTSPKTKQAHLGFGLHWCQRGWTCRVWKVLKHHLSQTSKCCLVSFGWSQLCGMCKMEGHGKRLRKAMWVRFLGQTILVCWNITSFAMNFHWIKGSVQTCATVKWGDILWTLVFVPSRGFATLDDQSHRRWYFSPKKDSPKKRGFKKCSWPLTSHLICASWNCIRCRPDESSLVC